MAKKTKRRFDIGQRLTIGTTKASILERLIARMAKKFPTNLITYAIKGLADEEIRGRIYEPEL